MRASIVIRTLNEARYLDELLIACDKQVLDEGDDLEIVLIDSGSTDATLDIARSHDVRITHIAKDEFSFGRSLNRGSAFATGDVLVFISGHCIPADDRWLADLVRPIAEGVADYAYGRQLGRDRTKLSEQRLFDKYFPAMSAIPQEGFFCNNANAALRRSTWAHHRFDEELTGLEDMALARQVVAAGGAVAYVAEAVVFHVHDETWAQTRRRYEREAIALQRILPEVHVTPIDVVRFFTAGVLGDAAEALRQRRLGDELTGIVAFRAAQYLGAWLGNREHRATARTLKDIYFYPSA